MSLGYKIKKLASIYYKLFILGTKLCCYYETSVAQFTQSDAKGTLVRPEILFSTCLKENSS